MRHPLCRKRGASCPKREFITPFGNALDTHIKPPKTRKFLSRSGSLAPSLRSCDIPPGLSVRTGMHPGAG